MPGSIKPGKVCEPSGNGARVQGCQPLYGPAAPLYTGGRRELPATGSREICIMIMRTGGPEDALVVYRIPRPPPAAPPGGQLDLGTLPRACASVCRRALPCVMLPIPVGISIR